MTMGSDSELSRYSIDLAVNMVAYYKWLTGEKKEFVMAKQILRSGTSIGANIHEAYYAVSKPDFIAKMQIALKETSETEYWLIVLERAGYWNEKFVDIISQCLSLKRMLIATLNTTKRGGASNE